MLNEQEDSFILNENSDNTKITESESEKKLEKKGSDGEDPKPRIVLTFRSEKSGAKNSNMKIVSSEEKRENVSPRRSSRTRGLKWESDDDIETQCYKKEQKMSVSMSENDDASDSSHTPKRSSRRRSREFSDNVLANAIARKEKSFNETSTPSQRLSRRIKPTAKVLANKELRIGVESQNNARLGITSDKSPEEGVRTRRSARRKSVDKQSQVTPKSSKMNKNSSVILQDEDEVQVIDDDSQSSERKLKHLCELGLKAIDSSLDEMSMENDERETEDEYEPEIEDDEEGDDESEVISKLIEADAESVSESSDEEFYCSASAKKAKRPRRSTRLCSSLTTNENEERSSPTQLDDENKSQPRRSSRKTRGSTDPYSVDCDNIPAAGDEASEATCPEEDSTIIATCFCETSSNIYAAPEELTEPVFCQAIDMVDGVRVGCSHSAHKVEGSYGALVRPGLRAPYFMACKLHIKQLQKHMCCPACGLFCTEGIFYQCLHGHLFHLECGLPYNDSKTRPGCPHCGVYSYRWQPVNRECFKVKVEMKSSNKRIFLPEQRLQCTPAYASFSSLRPSQLEQSPEIPKDLLPLPLEDIKELFEKAQQIVNKEALSDHPEQDLYDAIMAGETIEQLVLKIVPGMDINKVLEESGESCCHGAARRGHLAALYLLQYAAAQLDVTDTSGRTPLMVAILALLERKSSPVKKKDAEDMHLKKEDVKDETDNKMEVDVDDEKCEVESIENDSDQIRDEDLFKVIKYLVAAGCNVNMQGPEGMTALHMAAQHGSVAVCEVILSAPGAQVDPRDHGGWTPLVWAAEHSHCDVVKLLLREHADPTSCDGDGNAPVHWCALAGAARCLLLLLDAAPTAIASPNRHTDTPLHVAARQGNYACVVILLARGARTDVENSAGELPVDVSSDQCKVAISLSMHVAMTVNGGPNRRRLLSSDISRGRETYPVPCVNELDEEPAPQDFAYVTQLVVPEKIALDNTLDTMQGCTCSEEDCGLGECACCVLGVRRWYSRGRLLPSFPYHEPPMLFECNQTCACNPKKCMNSVLGRALRLGSTLVRAEVFRTARRGWGLRAAGVVPRGAPVATYCGELLAAAAADARPRDHYMFALDLKQDLADQCAEKTQLCVDAARYGSAARFVNHSCRPNLAPVRVFPAARDLRLPTVALFATRDIRAGEELTFDYGDKFWSVKSKWMKCECGEPECRYPAITEETDS